MRGVVDDGGVHTGLDSAQQRLGRTDGMGAIAHQLCTDFLRGGVQFFRWHHLVYQLQFTRLFGTEFLASDEITRRLPSPHGSHHIGADNGGGEAQFDLTQTKARILSRDDNIRTGDESDSATESSALNPCDDGLGAAPERVHQFGELGRILTVGFQGGIHHPLHPAEIRAGGEIFADGADQNDARCIIAHENLKVRDDLLDHLVVECIAFLVVVEFDAGDAG